MTCTPTSKPLSDHTGVRFQWPRPQATDTSPKSCTSPEAHTGTRKSLPACLGCGTAGRLKCDTKDVSPASQADGAISGKRWDTRCRHDRSLGLKPYGRPSNMVRISTDVTASRAWLGDVQTRRVGKTRRYVNERQVHSNDRTAYKRARKPYGRASDKST
jgi:hypothetical protein